MRRHTPGRGLVFFVITFFSETSIDKKSRDSPQLRLGIRPPARLGGPIARCDVIPVPGSLPLGRWADEPPRRRVTEPTSRRARERQEDEPTSPAPEPIAIPDAPRECGFLTPPCSAFCLLSSPAHHSQRLAIRSGQPEPPRFAHATASSPAAVEELTPSRDPTTRPLRASPRRP